MDIQKRALYNSLRMSWLLDPSLAIASWQVENYREMTTPLIFSNLEKFNLYFTKETFVSLAEDFDTPEELVEEILENEEFSPEDEDRIYLLLFELWRRTETDKPCLSVFCDELDHQIFLFDQQQTQKSEDIEDAISNLHVILNENTDRGGDPIEVLTSINQGCANDIETFLYDYIDEQIENQNYSYASDLVDSFIDYIVHEKWFDLLQVRILGHTDPEGVNVLLQQLAEETLIENDLQFNLDVLSEMVREGEHEIFTQLVEQTSQLLTLEEDFQDLLAICTDYFGRRDKESQENQIQELILKRQNRDPQNTFEQQDSDLQKFREIIRAS